ncbi:MAG: GAF domain-containing sensor histidine kinase [Deltaproteobacteria bacterium]|nr:GAF domain-containing sensor histidine kinase [Deltaproteobacteria bacterium]
MKLRTVLLALNLVVFLLPLVGFSGLRVYDTQLVRQTQAELVAQGAVIAAAFREAIVSDTKPGKALAGPIDDTPTMARIELDTTFDRVLPRAPEAVMGDRAPEAYAADAGQQISKLIQQTKTATLAGIRVTDFRGIVVASSGNELGQSLAHREEVALALSGQVASGLRERVASDPAPAPLSSISRNTGWRVFVALPILDGDRLLGAVVLSRTPMTLGKALWNDRYYLASIISLMLVVVLFVSLLGTWLIARPVEQLTAFSERVAQGGAAAKETPKIARPQELVTLAQAFSHMAEALEVRASYIKTFAAAVSHEFKTPLTSIRGAIELLGDHLDTMPKEQRQKFLAQIGADTERLDRLVRRLLELARADVATKDTSDADLLPVLEAIAANKRTADVAITVSGSAARAKIGIETLETVVSNLVDNAMQHGARPMTIALELSPGERVILRVRDDGPGISERNAARIFEPFFTTSREKGGTGLGLNICKTLIEARGGSIALEPSARGACFAITLLKA